VSNIACHDGVVFLLLAVSPKVSQSCARRLVTP
jgi:hypothetical protein